MRESLGTALQARLVLLANHVIAREPAAMERLRAHAGRTLRVEPAGAPAWLPALPPLALAVTPAGLVEASAASDADLHLRVAIDQPSQWLAAAAGGTRPPVAIEGDAGFAADVNWLADNLRWDLEAELAGFAGPVVAHAVATAARAAAQALRAWLPGAAPGAPVASPGSAAPTEPTRR